MVSSQDLHDNGEDTDSNVSAIERLEKRWATNTPEKANSNPTDNLQDSESNVSSTTFSDSRKNESSEQSDTSSNNSKDDSSENDEDNASLYKKDTNPKKTIKGRIYTRKRAAIGGIVGLLIGGGMSVSVLLAPNFLITHLREIILNRVSQVQVHQTRKYRRSKISKISDMFSKEGRIGGKVIYDMEKRGYKFSYDPNTKKVIGMTLPDGSRSLTREAIGNHMDDYMEVKHPLRTSRWKTKRTNALYKRFGISRTSVVSSLGSAASDPDKEINKRIARNTLDTPEDQAGVSTEAPPKDETPDQKKIREESSAAVEKANKSSGVFSEIRQQIKEGENLDTAAKSVGLEAGETVVSQISAGAGEELVTTAKNLSEGVATGTKALDGLKGVFSPTNILDKVCTVKKRLRLVVTLARYSRSLALLKYTSTFIGVADSVRTGKVDSKLLNSVMKRVTSEDRYGNPIGASPGFAYALKGKYSKFKNSSSKGLYGVDGTLSGTWKGVQTATDNIPVTSVRQCGVIQNPVFQVGSGVITTVIGVFTGGEGFAAEESIQVVVTTAIKQSIQDTIEGIFTKQFIKTAAIGALGNFAFDQMMTMTQMYIEKSLSLPVTTQEKGAELGSILIAGGGVANKQRSLASGMVPATVEQYAVSKNEYIAWEKNENNKMGVMARIFDTENPNSLAFQAALTVPPSLSGMANYLKSGFLNSVASVTSGKFITNIFNGRIYADDQIATDEYTFEKGPHEGQKIAVDFAGNPQMILRSDIEAIDPEVNTKQLITNGDIDATTLEPLSNRFKNHVANCVDTLDIISKVEFETTSSNPDPDHDCMAVNPLTVQFKAHLAFLDMIDGVNAEFDPGSI